MNARRMYSSAELARETLRDLAVDVRCAERDGLHDYARKCRADFARLWAVRRAPALDRYGWPLVLK